MGSPDTIRTLIHGNQKGISSKQLGPFLHDLLLRAHRGITVSTAEVAGNNVKTAVISRCSPGFPDAKYELRSTVKSNRPDEPCVVGHWGP
jgi:hypothetical protein